MRIAALFASLVLAGAASGVQSAQCTAASGERRVALLELYTSEGCDSCPPVDRWVSTLPARELGLDRLVVLGFHVDYWNYLGWPDPFAQRQFTERQQGTKARNRTRFVYTPQLLLDGRDFRRGVIRDDISERVAALNQRPPGASLKLDLDREAAGTLTVKASVLLNKGQPQTARFYIALYENGLSTQVTRGENRGKQLQHDFVVRELAGPFPASPGRAVEMRHGFQLAADWRLKDLYVSAFVQDSESGEVLQALARRACA